MKQKLMFFHKVFLQDYLTSYDVRTYLTRYSIQKSIKTFSRRTKAFELSFFPHCAKEWGNLSEKLRNIDSINTFKLSILKFVRPREN